MGVLLVTSAGVGLPTALSILRAQAAPSPAAALQWSLTDSRETAFLLLAMYAGYVYFRLRPVPSYAAFAASAAAGGGPATPAPKPTRGFRSTDQTGASDTGRGLGGGGGDPGVPASAYADFPSQAPPVVPRQTPSGIWRRQGSEDAPLLGKVDIGDGGADAMEAGGAGRRPSDRGGGAAADGAPGGSGGKHLSGVLESVRMKGDGTPSVDDLARSRSL